MFHLLIYPQDDIPESLFAQMRTCQTAANEFLRQFWAAVYPPNDGTMPLTATQKSAKISKMTGYLGKTPEKVNAIVEAARRDGVDAGKIEVASSIFRFCRFYR